MKPKIRAPYFEIGTKNYIYGDKVLEYAIAADKAAEKYDIDVLFICPAVEIRQVAQNTKNNGFWSSWVLQRSGSLVPLLRESRKNLWTNWVLL